MSLKEKWVERKFIFDFPAIKYSNFILRLKQTPSRLESIVKQISKEILIRRDGNSWSIQENVGHLLKVEDLSIGRLEDYQNNLITLRAADVTGSRTDKEDYNSKNINFILTDFRALREDYVKQLEKLEKSFFEKKSFHPRLNIEMRLCDLLYFQVEHDEHHIKKIDELKRKWEF